MEIMLGYRSYDGVNCSYFTAKSKAFHDALTGDRLNDQVFVGESNVVSQMNSSGDGISTVAASTFTEARTTTILNEVASPRNEVSYSFDYNEHASQSGAWNLERSSQSAQGSTNSHFSGDFPNSGGQNTILGLSVPPMGPRFNDIGTLLDFVFRYDNALSFVQCCLDHPWPIACYFSDWSEEYIREILSSQS